MSSSIKAKTKADRSRPSELATLSRAAKEARREYQRNWQRNNKDKVRAAQNRYWEKKAQAAEQLTKGNQC